MNNLMASLQKLVDSMGPITRQPRHTIPMGISNRISKHQMSKISSDHKKGISFKPRTITRVKVSVPGFILPQYISPTPAQYRRMHLGKASKENGS